MKWPRPAPKSRRSAAAALTTLTCALLGSRRGAPDPALLRAALLGWAFNPAARRGEPPPAAAKALA